VEPDASADQLLTNLLIAVAGVQSHIAEEFVLHEGFPCSFPLSLSLYIRGEKPWRITFSVASIAGGAATTR